MPGQRDEEGLQPIEKHGGFGTRVAAGVELERGEQHPGGVEAGMGAFRRVETFQGERGAPERDERDRDLRNHEGAAEKFGARHYGGRAAAGAEDVDQIGPRGPERGCEAGEQCCESRERDGHEEHAAAQIGGERDGQRRVRDELAQQIGHPPCEQHADKRAGSGEQQAFGEQLADESQPAGAERLADAHLALTRTGPDKHERPGAKHRAPEVFAAD